MSQDGLSDWGQLLALSGSRFKLRAELVLHLHHVWIFLLNQHQLLLTVKFGNLVLWV